MSYTYKYPRPSVTVDIIIFRREENDTKVLLIRRGQYPFEWRWAFPGGFLEMNEELEESARRELKEETSLEVNELEQLQAFGKIGRDPRGRTISVVFYGFADNENQKVKGGDDASRAQWFPVNEVPPLAFDHDEILQKALEKIK